MEHTVSSDKSSIHIVPFLSALPLKGRHRLARPGVGRIVAAHLHGAPAICRAPVLALIQPLMCGAPPPRAILAIHCPPRLMESMCPALHCPPMLKTSMKQHQLEILQLLNHGRVAAAWSQGSPPAFCSRMPWAALLSRMPGAALRLSRMPWAVRMLSAAVALARRQQGPWPHLPCPSGSWVPYMQETSSRTKAC